jgi:hypothetical protein
MDFHVKLLYLNDKFTISLIWRLCEKAAHFDATFDCLAPCVCATDLGFL